MLVFAFFFLTEVIQRTEWHCYENLISKHRSDKGFPTYQHYTMKNGNKVKNGITEWILSI